MDIQTCLCSGGTCLPWHCGALREKNRLLESTFLYLKKFFLFRLVFLLIEVPTLGVCLPLQALNWGNDGHKENLLFSGSNRKPQAKMPILNPHSGTPAGALPGPLPKPTKMPCGAPLVGQKRTA